ncbi:hypothetical protein O181_121742 [Austropuccinia psidii MF-1]|uniref:Integrase catalytic domain-containing protein n=1 Tax=Austropuccinia psidii MF-1 TaxID=1389203 RepID=A0A9Q3KJI4_9BASI|nr:hypothetical protein [Austropuccinia psidii MF-1]
MLGTKLASSTSYHPQTDGMAESIIQIMENIFSKLCAHGMEYKYHEGYAHDLVTLIPTIQLAYETTQQSTTGKTPSIIQKGWNPLFTVDHLKKNILAIHPTAKGFCEMWKKACETGARCIAETEEYNNRRYGKTHKEAEFREGDHVLVFTLNFNKLKGPKKIGEEFLGQFTITRGIKKN